MARSKYDRTVERGAEEVARLVGERNSRYASPSEVLDQAEEWTTDQVVCRLAHHRFTVPRVAIHNKRYHYFYIELDCEGGCGVFQKYEMNERHHIYWGPHLDYREAKNYLSKTGRVLGEAKDALRGVWVKRVLDPSITRGHVPPRGGDPDA